MTRSLLNGLVTVFAAALLIGCAGKDEVTKDEGAVDDRGLSGSELEAFGPGTRSHGVTGPGDFPTSPLGDPGNPMAVRIIYFEFDSSEIRSDYQPIIEAHAAYLADNPNAVLTLEGHADERGSREYNLALGERRAVSVQRRLMLLGAAANQIKTVSYGEERPLQEGHNDESYTVNRRAELVY